MLSLADVTLLLLVAATAAICFILTTLQPLRKHMAAARKYRLFAVRDDLLMLVAEGKLSEDSRAFKRYYESINFLVNNTNYLTLGTLISALMAAKKKGLDPSDEDVEIKRELERNRDLAKWLMSFYRELMAIIRDNSLFLRTLLLCRGFLPKRKEPPSHLPAVQRKAWEFYRDYSRASNRLSVAA
jgi:hypothetical protein